MELLNQCGAQIRLIRSILGYTEQKFAKVLDINVLDLQAYECGEKEVPMDVSIRAVGMWDALIESTCRLMEQYEQTALQQGEEPEGVDMLMYANQASLERSGKRDMTLAEHDARTGALCLLLEAADVKVRPYFVPEDQVK